MNILAIICFTVAVLLMIVAVIYQRRDMLPNYGSTMGGEMTAGALWLLVSLLAACGSLAFIHWILSFLLFLGLFALSFLIRALIARIAKA